MDWILTIQDSQGECPSDIQSISDQPPQLNNFNVSLKIVSHMGWILKIQDSQGELPNDIQSISHHPHMLKIV